MSREEVEEDIKQFCCGGEVGVGNEAEEREKQGCLFMFYDQRRVIGLSFRFYVPDGRLRRRKGKHYADTEIALLVLK